MRDPKRPAPRAWRASSFPFPSSRWSFPSLTAIAIVVLLACDVVAQPPPAKPDPTKTADPKKADPPKSTPPAVSSKKDESKKEEMKKDEPKKPEAKKEEPKKEEPKKEEPKKEEPKKPEAKKEESKKEEPKKPEAKKEEPAATLPASYAEALAWRSLGPSVMGGRIVALAVYEADPTTFWAATASGGLLKTVNNGITFEHQFDRESTVSIGDVAVAPSNKDIVWVGTGEQNPRNSVSYGDGVYKSVDGGKTWTCMGLRDSFQIGRVIIHPKDPNIVYVGALGRLYGPNPVRGVYKTADGGKTWERVLFLDDNTGIIDLKMHPKDPNTLLAAAFERRRDGFDGNDTSVEFGAKAGIYKTVDGGKTWNKLTKGLPTNKIGRVGLDFHRNNANTVFAIVECEQIGRGPATPTPAAGAAAPGRPAATAPQERQAAYLGMSGDPMAEGEAVLTSVTSDGPAAAAGLESGDVIKKFGEVAITNYASLTEEISRRKPGDKVAISILRDKQPMVINVTLGARPGMRGGGGFMGMGRPGAPFGSMLGGQIENVQERQGDKGFEYGGVYKSTDGGESWERINSVNPRPMYFSQVRVDSSDDKFLWVLGISLHKSNDGGKIFRGDGAPGAHSDHHALWIDPKDGRHMILGNDGGVYVTYDRGAQWDHLNTSAIGQFYHVALDTRRNYRVYGGLQDNGSWGGPSRVANDNGSVNEDWFRIGGGDGFHCAVDPQDPDLIYFTSQNGAMGRRHLKTGENASIQPLPLRGARFRFNWNTPFLLSNHNSRIFYAAGNYVFRSLDRGENLTAISPEITRTPGGTATALAESPRDPNVIYAGTDDGNLWLTRDGGRNWTNLIANVGLSKPCHVATIEASRFATNRVYVCFDGHRSDIDDPLIYVSDDFGVTWKSLRGQLPVGSTRCLREDFRDGDVLYLGTEFGIWASVDRGESWTRINNTLPTVAVHEIAQHPTSGELVIATHGRSIWAVEITPIRRLSKNAREADVTLMEPVPAVKWRTQPARGGTNRRFVASNPSNGATLFYVLKKPAENAALKVYDFQGQLVRELRANRSPGLHRISWDLTGVTPPRSGAPAGAGMLQRMTRFRQRTSVPDGWYRVVLTVDGKEFSQGLRVINDPDAPPTDNLTEVRQDFTDEDLLEEDADADRDEEKRESVEMGEPSVRDRRSDFRR